MLISFPRMHRMVVSYFYKRQRQPSSKVLREKGNNWKQAWLVVSLERVRPFFAYNAREVWIQDSIHSQIAYNTHNFWEILGGELIENCSDGTFSVLYFSIEALFSLASYINFEHKIKGDHTLSELAGQTSPVIRRIPLLIRTIQPDQIIRKWHARQWWVLVKSLEGRLLFHF